jgi:hypothetical protein
MSDVQLLNAAPYLSVGAGYTVIFIVSLKIGTPIGSSHSNLMDQLTLSGFPVYVTIIFASTLSPMKKSGLWVVTTGLSAGARTTITRLFSMRKENTNTRRGETERDMVPSLHIRQCGFITFVTVAGVMRESGSF